MRFTNKLSNNHWEPDSNYFQQLLFRCAGCAPLVRTNAGWLAPRKSSADLLIPGLMCEVIRLTNMQVRSCSDIFYTYREKTFLTIGKEGRKIKGNKARKGISCKSPIIGMFPTAHLQGFGHTDPVFLSSDCSVALENLLESIVS